MPSRGFIKKRQAEVDRAIDKQLIWLEEERQKYWSKQDPNIPGIHDFYTGKNILVTGGTGFIGKVLVEHLLRLVPGVGKIFMIIRVKRNQDANERLNTILNSELYGWLRTLQPEAINKVVAISGDLSTEGMGISQEDRITLQNEVSAVFHAAASIRFDDPLKKAVLLNTRGTHELIEMCKGMRNLKTFVHVSTLYCNTDQKIINEMVYPTPFDWRTMIKIAERNSKDDLEGLSLKFLGYQPNTYTFTKQMSEKIVDDAGREIPVIIVRPAVVTPMRGNPLDGYMENLNGIIGFVLGILPGIMRVALVNKDVHLNLTSVDGTAKVVLGAGWVRGTNQRLQDDPDMTDVINASAEDIFSETFENLRNLIPDLCEHVTPKGIQAPRFSFTTNPWVYRYKMFISHILLGLIVDFALRLVGMKPRLMKIYRKIYTINNALNRFMMQNFPSKTGNLWKCLSIIKDNDFMVVGRMDIMQEAVAQWNYACKHIVPQEQGNRTVFNLLQVFEYVKSVLKFMFYFWVVWKLLLILLSRLI